MGIKQLTSYFMQHGRTLYTDEMDLKGKKIVFDGDGLFHKLVQPLPIRFGGDYDIIYSRIKAFFESLTELRIIPYVVLDGGKNVPLKQETICERSRRYIQSVRTRLNETSKSECGLPKPLLSKLVFIEVLHELEIHFVVAKGEADLLVVAMANRIGCPVVGSDSDFFVTDVTHGVIPMDPLLANLEKTSSSVIYYSRNLAIHLGIEESMLPFIAVIMGNDYSSDVYLEQIQKNCGVRNKNGTLLEINPRMHRIGEYLRSFRSRKKIILDLSARVVNGVRKIDFDQKQEIKSILAEFDLSTVQIQLDELFPILEMACTLPQKVSNVFVDGYTVGWLVRQAAYFGLAHSCILDIHDSRIHFTAVQCEDISKKSSCLCSEELRFYLHSIVTSDHTSSRHLQLNEFRRSGNTYKKFEINIPGCEYKYPIDILKESYSHKDKKEILHNLTKFPVHCLTDEEQCHVIFIMSVRYWLKRNSVLDYYGITLEHVQALVICYILLQSSATKFHDMIKFFDLQTAHCYCQWQSVLFYIVLLNVLFCYPYPAPRLSMVFNGSCVHSLCERLNKGENPRRILAKTSHAIFDILMIAVTEDLNDCIANRHHHESHNESKKMKEQPKTSSNKFEHQILAGNRFAALMGSDDES